MIYKIDNLIGQSVPFNENLIFFDIETANDQDDICQIGAIVTSQGKIVDVIEQLVKPFGDFNKPKYHQNLHGISPEMVKNSPNFRQVWEKCFNFLDISYTFVTHGADSDINNVFNNLLAYHLTVNPIQATCTWKLAKHYMIGLIDSFTRESICEYYSLPMVCNHNALSDALDCLHIFISLLKNYKLNWMCATFTSIYTQPIEYERKVSSSNYDVKFAGKRRLSSAEVAATSVNEILDKDFAGKRVVITGDFKLYPDRTDVQLEIIRRGGSAPSSVSKLTDMLICGSNPGEKKIEKAKQLNVRIVDEETFYKMLESNDAIDEE